MGTAEQKSLWRQILVGIIIGAFIALFTLMLSRFERKMNEFQNLQIEMILQQKMTQELLMIEYRSTDWALFIMFDGEYQDIKKEKKKELIKDYEFKNKSKGD
jgi:hypothetical protein